MSTLTKETTMIKQKEIDAYKKHWYKNTDDAQLSFGEPNDIDEHIEKMQKLIGRKVVWDTDYHDKGEDRLIGKGVMTVTGIGWNDEWHEPTFFEKDDPIDRWFSYEYALENLLCDQ
jgi:hypothetical protein